MPSTPKEHSSEYPPSAEYKEYMQRLIGAYENNEAAFDKIAALTAVDLDIRAEPDDSPLRYRSGPSDYNTERDVLSSYFNCLVYKAYHPEWEQEAFESIIEQFRAEGIIN